MSSLGWYSGETHVHRWMTELPNAMLAADLDVALPLTHWVTRAYTPPNWPTPIAAAMSSCGWLLARRWPLNDNF